jgi:iron complex outermembrane receptor protein
VLLIGFGTTVFSLNIVADDLLATNLAMLSLEKLMDLEVTTSARHPETLAETPAAISVITQEDIHRSGAKTIPEALRLVPGLDVAQVDGSEWAVSARGFNDVFANKLLVLQDGRTLYTPLFSGVFWDVQGAMMEDIDRIEVIRGPGATLWGANAVDGVINIITKSAKDTQGTFLSFGGGSEERGFFSARYGQQIADNAYLRVYGTYYNRDDTVRPDTGDRSNDSWQIGRAGFRLDWEAITNQDLGTLQGDVYRGSVNETFGTFAPANPPTLAATVSDEITVDGGDLLGRWTHTFSPESQLTVQSYYDRSERNTVIFKEKRDTLDLDFQDETHLLERNDLIWGGGYRYTHDIIGDTPTITFDPDSRGLNLYSFFAQDEITIFIDRLRLSLGSKFEHNDFTGWEIQPGARLLWTPQEHHTFWASVSRAVRTPSRAEEDIALSQAVNVFPGVYLPVTIHGNPSFESEKLVAYELGYRAQPFSRLSLEISTFFNDYDSLRSFESSAVDPTQITVGNKLYGSTCGFEAGATITILPNWRLKPSYTLLDMDLHHRADSTDTLAIMDEGKSPQQQALLRSELDLPCNLTLDCALRYVDSLPALNVPHYTTFDMRLAWKATKNLELAIGGNNLLQPQHQEFAPSFIQTQRAEIQRAVYGQATIRF